MSIQCALLPYSFKVFRFSFRFECVGVRNLFSFFREEDDDKNIVKMLYTTLTQYINTYTMCTLYEPYQAIVDVLSKWHVVLFYVFVCENRNKTSIYKYQQIQTVLCAGYFFFFFHFCVQCHLYHTYTRNALALFLVQSIIK